MHVRCLLPVLVLVLVLQVTNSAKLKRLLAVVLAVGNFLNEGTGSGDAKAITLESLLKITTVRSVGNLHYAVVARFCRRCWSFCYRMPAGGGAFAVPAADTAREGSTRERAFIFI